MRRVALLALGLMLVGVGPHDGARGQTSATPPVSLAPPDASPPRTSAKNSRLPPAAAAGRASTSVLGEPVPVPNPAADYDGFSAVDDNDTPSQVTPPVRSRAAKSSVPNSDTKGNAAQQLIDQDDEALKRKLTICKNCK